MLRRLVSLLVLFVLFVVFLGAPRAIHALPSAAEFLRAELESRRDNDFTGTLTKIQKKQQKAVGQSLEFLLPFIEQDNFASRVDALTKLTKSLSKAYPAEFAPMDATGNLRGLVANVFTQLYPIGDTATHELQAELPGIGLAKLRAKAQAALTSAEEDIALARAAPDFASALKSLKSAAKSIAKGLGYAAKDPPHETFSATLDIDANPFDAQNVTATYTASFRGFFINGNSQVGPKFTSIDLDGTLPDPFMPGPVSATAKVYVGSSPAAIATTYYKSNVTIVFTAFDPVAKTLRASFSFTADTLGNPGPLLVVNVTDGVIDVSKLTVE